MIENFEVPDGMNIDGVDYIDIEDQDAVFAYFGLVQRIDMYDYPGEEEDEEESVDDDSSTDSTDGETTDDQDTDVDNGDQFISPSDPRGSLWKNTLTGLS